MSEKFPPKVNWQPISTLPLIGSMIDGLLGEVEQQYGNLQSCRTQPLVLDDYTVARVIKVYTDQAGDVGLYAEQLSRWSGLHLTPSQRREVARLSEQIPHNPRANQRHPGFGRGVEGGHTRAVLGKSDLEVGLEFLVGERKP